MQWIHETPPRWDADKARLLAAAPPGSLPASVQAQALERPAGTPLAGDWWRVDLEGAVVGYGWMDIVWGDGEVLLVVDPQAQGSGVGSFIMERLAEEAAARGIRYIHNALQEEHPQRTAVAQWLTDRRFQWRSAQGRWVRQVA